MSTIVGNLISSLTLWGSMAVPAHAAEIPLRFEFGSGKASHSRSLVSPDTKYTNEKGFGLEPDSAAKAEIRAGRTSRGRYLTSDAPFRFSVAVPEGDYRVTLRLGDPDGDSETTVKAESRRLMLERVTTKKGEFTTRSFVVNVRNALLAAPPLNAPGGAEIRLNNRERLTYTWDDKLTLEFSGRAPKVAAVQIERVQVPRIFLLGDSTVTDQSMDPGASWGQMLPRFFGSDISVANYAESGETLKSFITSLRLDKVLSEVRPGDWIFIQFAHNDEKAQWPQTYAPAETTYRSYLRVYIAEARRLGATPILVTPVQRRTFDATGHITNSHGGYPDAVRAVAAEEHVPLVDLHAMSTTFYEALGVEHAPLAFAQNGQDATHHDNYGAYELARCVVRAIQNQALPLASHLVPGIAVFDPAHPDSPEGFKL